VNCHICRNPILPHQPSYRRPELVHINIHEHQNPADHLPTPDPEVEAIRAQIERQTEPVGREVIVKAEPIETVKELLDESYPENPPEPEPVKVECNHQFAFLVLASVDPDVYERHCPDCGHKEVAEFEKRPAPEPEPAPEPVKQSSDVAEMAKIAAKPFQFRPWKA